MSSSRIPRGELQGPESRAQKLAVEELRSETAGAAKSPQWGELPPRTWRPLQEALEAHQDPDNSLNAAVEDQAAGALFVDAYAEGFKRGQQALKAMVERFEACVAELESARRDALETTRADLVELALTVAREAIAGDSEGRQAFCQTMVDHSLQLMQEADSITLRLAPADAAALKLNRPELFGEGSRVRCIEDSKIGLGGVVAECELGRVDATLENRLQRIARQLDLSASNDDFEGAAEAAS